MGNKEKAKKGLHRRRLIVAQTTERKKKNATDRNKEKEGRNNAKKVVAPKNATRPAIDGGANKRPAIDAVSSWHSHGTVEGRNRKKTPPAQRLSGGAEK